MGIQWHLDCCTGADSGHRPHMYSPHLIPECAVTTPSSSPGTDMLPIIAGAVAGVVIVIAITLIVIVAIIKKRRKSSYGLRNLNIG